MSLTFETLIWIFCAFRLAWIDFRLALKSEPSSLMMTCPLVTCCPSLKGRSIILAETRADIRTFSRGSTSPGDAT